MDALTLSRIIAAEVPRWIASSPASSISSALSTTPLQATVPARGAWWLSSDRVGQTLAVEPASICRRCSASRRAPSSALAPEPLLGGLTPGQFIGTLTQKGQLPCRSLSASRSASELTTGVSALQSRQDPAKQTTATVRTGLAVSPQRQLQRTRPDIVYPKRRIAGSAYCTSLD
jgi:hypothetical protein